MNSKSFKERMELSLVAAGFVRVRPGYLCASPELAVSRAGLSPDDPRVLDAVQKRRLARNNERD